MKKKVCYILLLALLPALLTACNSPSKEKYPIYGIDISHHQNRVDWNTVEQQGISFVFLKATEGESHKDTRFVEYWSAITHRSFKRGAYHYFSFCKEGELQAKNFIESARLEKGDLPPVIDLEYAGNCKKSYEPERLVQEIEICLKRLEEHYSVEPIIYTTNSFYKDIVSRFFKNRRIWIRNTYFNPSLSNRRNWIFWQYKVGTLPGITGDVDLNVFNGSKEDFEAYTIK